MRCALAAAHGQEGRKEKRGEEKRWKRREERSSRRRV